MINCFQTFLSISTCATTSWTDIIVNNFDDMLPKSGPGARSCVYQLNITTPRSNTTDGLCNLRAAVELAAGAYTCSHFSST